MKLDTTIHKLLAVSLSQADTLLKPFAASTDRSAEVLNVV